MDTKCHVKLSPFPERGDVLIKGRHRCSDETVKAMWGKEGEEFIKHLRALHEMTLDKDVTHLGFPHTQIGDNSDAANSRHHTPPSPRHIGRV